MHTTACRQRRQPKNAQVRLIYRALLTSRAVGEMPMRNGSRIYSVAGQHCAQVAECTSQYRTLVKRARSSRVRRASDASIHVGDGCCVGLWFTRLWGVWPGRIFIHHQSHFSRFQQIINFLLPTREVSICVTAVLSTASVAVHVGIPFIQANDDHRQPLAVIPSWPRERRW